VKNLKALRKRRPTAAWLSYELQVSQQSMALFYLASDSS